MTGYIFSIEYNSMQRAMNGHAIPVGCNPVKMSLGQRLIQAYAFCSRSIVVKQRILKKYRIRWQRFKKFNMPIYDSGKLLWGAPTNSEHQES